VPEWLDLNIIVPVSATVVVVCVGIVVVCVALACRKQRPMMNPGFYKMTENQLFSAARDPSELEVVFRDGILERHFQSRFLGIN
jgi:hypothetical protein